MKGFENRRSSREPTVLTGQHRANLLLAAKTSRGPVQTQSRMTIRINKDVAL
jgi:hypothetical protein